MSATKSGEGLLRERDDAESASNLLRNVKQDFKKQAALLADPAYVAELERIEQLEEEAQRLEQLAAAQAKREWELRDAALHTKFLREKQKRCQQEEERAKQENALLQAVVEGLGEAENGEVTQNPEPPEGYGRREIVHPKGEPCPFFTKTGACRFGIQCSRYHDYPDQSRTLLFPNMYSHFGLEHLALDIHDSDVALEYSDSESYQHFRDFFEDTLPEFQRCGIVLQFKVCCNTSPHLRGNVYVQYSSIEAAMKARTLFNGRWYAGRQLTCLYINLERWKQAVCGLFWRQKCPKGGQCNFLHAYRNPGNAFWRADQDLHLESPKDSAEGFRCTPTPRNNYDRHQETSKTYSGSVRNARNAYRSRAKKQIKKVKKQVSRAKKQIKKVKKQVSRAKKQIKKVKKQVSRAKKQIKKVKKQVSRAKKQIKKADQEADQKVKSRSTEPRSSDQRSKKQIKKVEKQVS
ncbi:putative U2 small nuclear ribonucleoprotein auxiliary factor 35 kDa subunit-related protein 2 [Penaeus vannamei]|uniref:Putative U2 small nuclear ribonucleoprotein auxiliary factor 35 kDa subunit-related protein 2 n=1 Tax=Penaeus vannamei TaxID=6689 RepID=A0A3R7P796_PENVA|nr:putative U2 small nuclear ribonucleoprotein auxiliary factor 35 kDa subunit-related protein 2 [Penaeus vannamei]